MVSINKAIFKKNFTTTPQKISTAIISLCREINPESQVVAVSVQPDINAIISECFPNVMKKVEMAGGSICYGWTIWEWRRVFIEAEHHAVWEKDGLLIDITPKTNGEKNIMFLPDQSKVYNWVTKRRINNVKRSLGIFNSAEEWLRAADEWQTAIENNSVSEETIFNELKYSQLTERRVSAFCRVISDLANDTKPSQTCICASGMRYRKCCRQFIELD